MAKQVTTLVIDHDDKFIELVKTAIDRTDNLDFAGSTSRKEDLSNLCNKINPQIVLLNIDIKDQSFQEFIKLIRKNFPETFIILMNLDDRNFADYNPEDKIADNYLDKNSLFEEIIKVSNYFEHISTNKTIKSYS